MFRYYLCLQLSPTLQVRTQDEVMCSKSRKWLGLDANPSVVMPG